MEKQELHWDAGLVQKSAREKHQAKYSPSRGILNTWKIERLNTGKVDLREELIQGFFLLLCFHVLVLGWGKQRANSQCIKFGLNQTFCSYNNCWGRFLKSIKGNKTALIK